jgi:hypothetical protein
MYTKSTEIRMKQITCLTSVIAFSSKLVIQTAINQPLLHLEHPTSTAIMLRSVTIGLLLSFWCLGPTEGLLACLAYSASDVFGTDLVQNYHPDHC